MTEYQYTVTAPGRVNLLGEHVDYCNGPVLPAAIDRAVSLRFAPREDERVLISALDLHESVCFSLRELEAKIDIHRQPLPGWAAYPAGVAHVLQHHNLPLRGMNAEFTSDIPIGAGLSSSAAVEVAFAVAWDTLSPWSLDRMTLARYCQEAENRYVGVNCGLMDQFASANGVADHALYFQIHKLHWEPIPMPPDIAIIIADSRMPHSLQTSEYNERRAATEEALHIFQTVMPAVSALVDVSPADFEAHKHLLPAKIAQRAQHVVYECDRVNQAVQALRAGDVAAFGKLMIATHASLRDLYEVSVPEIDFLVDTAISLPGCYGARITGGGFGGCTVNLVAAEQAETFAKELKRRYDQHTPYETEVYVSRASQGAHLLA
ncbi:MAG: galactokinase [Anaerolineae bacterium]|nr:galactokinase [Anaerolineae bacterium]